jgi:hypothetical protein
MSSITSVVRAAVIGFGFPRTRIMALAENGSRMRVQANSPPSADSPNNRLEFALARPTRKSEALLLAAQPERYA